MNVTSPLPDSPPPMRILVVEDNDSDAMIAQAAVEKAVRGRTEIERADSLAGGIGALRLTDPDLVLLDLNLPDSRGLETLDRMRVATRRPIIVITVEDRGGLDEVVLDHGAFEILHKGRLTGDAFVRLLRLAESLRRTEASLEESEARLVRLSRFDAVTDLPNRGLVEERLEQAIAQARRRSGYAAVLAIGLDRFRLINDSLGHNVGDQMLSEVGRRLKDCVRADDTVGRLGGDEFAVIVTDLARPDDAALVMRKIVDAFATPIRLRAQEAFITVSIGVVGFPGDGDRAADLLGRADTAMRRAKERTGSSFLFFAAEMNARATTKLQLHTDLHHALDRRELRLHYQPKVLLSSAAIIGLEALLRWQHPTRGLVSPMEFIPALEETGLIVQVGDWIIGEVLAQLRQWAREGRQLVPVAVNLSAKQFRRRDLDQVIHRLLAEHGISPRLLELEITESCLMDDPKDAVRQLHALRDAGLAISVDDFGTGYSSLSYLTRLPLSTLKIDRSFVNAAISDPGSAAIVKMVIDMSQSLRLNVVAEGIETDMHVSFLRQQGCAQGQGYHFGKPMTAEAIGPLLAQG